MRKKLYLLAILPILLAGCNEGVISTSSTSSTTSSTSSPSSTTSSTSSLVSEFMVYFDLNGGSSLRCPASKVITSITKDTFVYDVKKEDYNFRGWMYNDVVIFDELGNQINTVTLVDRMTFVAKFADTAKLHITTNNFEAVESISQDKECAYYTKVDIFAHPKQGYRFSGWYSVDVSGEEILVATEEEYKFQMWKEDTTLKAVFEINSYNLTIWSNNPDLGVVADSSDSTKRTYDTRTLSHQYLTNVTISAVSNTENVRFLGWYNEKNEEVAHDATYKFVMTNRDYKLEAKWNRFNITYILNGGTNDSRNPSEYSVESNIQLYKPTKENYTFAGWTLDGEEIIAIDGSWMKHIILTANWKASKYQVRVYSNDSSKGSVTGSGEYEWGSNVTVTSTPNGDFVFNGWYSDSGLTRLISKDASYTFVMPTEPLNLYAKFWTKAEEEAWNKAYGVIPVVSADKKTITYGLYPQTNVNDSSLISSLNLLTTPVSNGWYFYENEYYAKLTAKPHLSDYEFDNGTTIVSGQTYWFKCEPITWNILSNNGGEYFILSSVLLNTHRYEEKSNNYKNSEIRAWLNNEFYNSAFALDASYILTTEVDNSPSTTDSDTNPYACGNTFDKVFLPSYNDYENSSYGFVWLSDRGCKTTDYARANGAYIETSSNYLNNGWYWTRSPLSQTACYAWNVLDSGDLSFGWLNDSRHCVRPSITLNIAE